MPRFRPLAAVLLVAAVAIVLPAYAGAITLTRHIYLPHGVTHNDDRRMVVVTKVPPRDSDDDGYADACATATTSCVEDNCPHDHYLGNGGCTPEPPPVITTTSSVTTYEPTTVSTGSCPAVIPGYIIENESGGSSTAVNPSSGAYGCYQILPSTWNTSCGDLGAEVGSSTSAQAECASRLYAASGTDPWAQTR